MLSAGGVPVQPAPKVATPAFAREVAAVRAQMTAAERADPENAANNTPGWEAYFTLRRNQAVAYTNGLTPVVGRHNREGRLRW